jgi:hypothetical protein
MVPKCPTVPAYWATWAEGRIVTGAEPILARSSKGKRNQAARGT